MRIRLVIPGLLALLGIVSTSLGESDTKTPKFAILFTGWVTGTFGPCGCKVEPNGGFPRRASFSREFEKESGIPVIQVDAGSLFAPRGPDAKTINDAMLHGLEKLPVEVMNVGSEDLHVWPELALRREGNPRFISTNLVPRRGSIPRPERYVIVTVKASETGLDNDLRIGFLGVIDPSRVKPNSGFRGQDPVLAVAEVMTALAPKVDFVVLLADYFRRQEIDAASPLHQIASAHDQIYAILTTERQYILHSAEQVNNAIILSGIERGRQLGRLVFEFDAQGKVSAYEPDFVNLDSSVADDPELARRLRQLKSQVP